MKIDTHQGRIVHSDGRAYVNFSTTSYLNLAYEPRFIDWYTSGMQKLGCSYGSSPLSHPSISVYTQLEEMLADYYGAESALLFSSGYTASQSLVKLYISRGNMVEYGRIHHPSLLVEHQTKGKSIHASDIVDPIHCRLLDTKSSPADMTIVVDASHGFGVLDQTIKKHIAMKHTICGSLNKGLSTAAGIVLCTHAVREELVQASGYATSSAPSPAACFALIQAIKEGFIEEQKMKLQKLLQCIPVGDAFSYVHPFPVLKLTDTSRSMYQACLDNGLLIWHNEYPKKNGNALNRAIIHAGLREEDVVKLLDIIST